MSVSVIIIMGARGRMGSTIHGLAKDDPELSVAALIERPELLDGLQNLGVKVASSLDEVLPVPGAVVIDFTVPEVSMNTVRDALKHGVGAVIGTTGLSKDQQAELHEAAAKIPLLWAPNMSVGVNVLLKVLPELVRMLGPAYDMEMVEIHHNKKKDAPSGTALKLAQCLAEARGWDYDAVKNHCRDGIIGARPKDELGVQTIRGGDVVGDHTVYFLGPGERIEITHRAHSRETFAQGAIRAAKWLSGKKPGRLYGMADVL